MPARAGLGWLFSAIGLSATLAVLAEEYAKYALITSSGSLPFGLAVAWASNWLWAPSVVLPTTFLLLLFPDGQLSSRRWRPVAWTAAGILATLVVANALVPGPLDSLPHLTNPLGINLLASVLNGILAVTSSLYVMVTASWVVAVAVRFRRSRGDERQQLKWFAYAAGLLLGFLLLNVLAGDPNNLFFGVGLTLFPLATGIAVLQYRLYDIDRLISRTLVYGLLTALLGAVYAGVVLLLGQGFGGIGADPPSWTVATATLAVAALFRPARRRVQAMVDRRFNRRKYDAAKAVEAFSLRLREEVDLDALSAELLAVVDQTMQATTTSLWLKPSADPRPGAKAREISQSPELDPLHAMQFRPPPPPQVRDVRPVERPPPVDRDCPLDTAGDRCLWHAGGTAGENDDARRDDGSRPNCWVRPVLTRHCFVGKPSKTARQPGVASSL